MSLITNGNTPTFNTQSIRFESAAVKNALARIGAATKVADGEKHFPGFVLAQVRNWYKDNTSKAVKIGEKIQTAKEFKATVKQTWGGKTTAATVTTADKEQFILLDVGPQKQLVDCDAMHLEFETHGCPLDFKPALASELANWLDALQDKFIEQHSKHSKPATTPAPATATA